MEKRDKDHDFSIKPTDNLRELALKIENARAHKPQGDYPGENPNPVSVVSAITKN